METGEASPIGYARYADEYFYSAKMVDGTLGEQVGYEVISPMPAYFLAAHSIEMLLKSYLLYCGVAQKELKSFKLRHNLTALFKEAIKHKLCNGWVRAPNDVKLVLLLKKLNQNMAMRYMQRGDKEFPIWGSLELFMHRLKAHVFSKIGYESCIEDCSMYIGEAHK